MISLLERAYNPDVLDCLANLSNDEVFTPPKVANQVLDMLPEELWSDPDVKILDPFTKSGVFLREAAKRFIRGLEDVIPDLQERVDHVMHEQLFGIGITELTSLLARRSLYCSKYPNGRFRFPCSMARKGISASATSSTRGRAAGACSVGRQSHNIVVMLTSSSMPTSSSIPSIPRGSST